MALNSTLPSGGVGNNAYAICFWPACSADFNSTDNFQKLLAFARKLYSDFTCNGSWDKALTKVPPSGFTAANLSGSSLDWSIQRCFNCGDPNHKLKDCPQAHNEATINENRAKYKAASKGKSKSKAKRSKFAPPDNEDPREEKMIGGKLMKFHPNWTNLSTGKMQGQWLIVDTPSSGLQASPTPGSFATTLPTTALTVSPPTSTSVQPVTPDNAFLVTEATGFTRADKLEFRRIQRQAANLTAKAAADGKVYDH